MGDHSSIDGQRRAQRLFVVGLISFIIILTVTFSSPNSGADNATLCASDDLESEISRIIGSQFNPIPHLPANVHLTYKPIGRVPWRMSIYDGTNSMFVTGFSLLESIDDDLIRRRDFSQTIEFTFFDSRSNEWTIYLDKFYFLFYDLVFDRLGNMEEIRDYSEDVFKALPKNSPSCPAPL